MKKITYKYYLNFKKRFVFLHIKPYNKDIYEHAQCSTALLWRLVQSWELELIADVTATWKQWRGKGTETICWKIQWTPFFKSGETRQMFSGFLSCTDTKT